MTKAITLRLDESDHRALCEQAHRLRVRPGTLARMLVRASLQESEPTDPAASAPRAALERLARRSSRISSSVDAVTLVREARHDVGAE